VIVLFTIIQWSAVIEDEIETPKALKKEGHGKGVSPPQPTMGTGGAYASGVRGEAPAENRFWCIWSMKEHI